MTYVKYHSQRGSNAKKLLWRTDYFILLTVQCHSIPSHWHQQLHCMLLPTMVVKELSMKCKCQEVEKRLCPLKVGDGKWASNYVSFFVCAYELLMSTQFCRQTYQLSASLVNIHHFPGGRRLFQINNHIRSLSWLHHWQGIHIPFPRRMRQPQKEQA